MALPGLDMAYLIDSLRNIEILRYSRLACLSLVGYDYVLTFSDEVNLIWGSKWSLVKLLFLLNRYYILAGLILSNYAYLSPNLSDIVIVRSFDSPKTRCAEYLDSCLHYFRWEAWSAVVAFAMTQALLQIRIYALYELNKKILALMLVAFLSSSGISVWIMAKSSNGLTASAIPIPGGMFCDMSLFPSNTYTFWIPALAFESLLFVLAMIRGFETFKYNGSLFSHGNQLIGILVRDSLVYYLLIFVAYLSCIVIGFKAANPFIEVALGFSLVLPCIFSNRMILNIRQENEEIEYSFRS